MAHSYFKQLAVGFDGKTEIPSFTCNDGSLATAEGVIVRACSLAERVTDYAVGEAFTVPNGTASYAEQILCYLGEDGKVYRAIHAAHIMRRRSKRVDRTQGVLANTAAAGEGGAGSVISLITITAHGYSVGDFIYIEATTNYDGLHKIVSVPNANQIGIRVDFVAETPAGTEIEILKGTFNLTDDPMMCMKGGDSLFILDTTNENNDLADTDVPVALYRYHPVQCRSAIFQQLSTLDDIYYNAYGKNAINKPFFMEPVLGAEAAGTWTPNAALYPALSADVETYMADFYNGEVWTLADDPFDVSPVENRVIYDTSTGSVLTVLSGEIGAATTIYYSEYENRMLPSIGGAGAQWKQGIPLEFDRNLLKNAWHTLVMMNTANVNTAITGQVVT